MDPRSGEEGTKKNAGKLIGVGVALLVALLSPGLPK